METHENGKGNTISMSLTSSPDGQEDVLALSFFCIFYSHSLSEDDWGHTQCHCRPVKPDEFDWSEHFPAFFPATEPEDSGCGDGSKAAAARNAHESRSEEDAENSVATHTVHCGERESCTLLHIQARLYAKAETVAL